MAYSTEQSIEGGPIVSPLETMLGKLPTAKKSGKGWVARCPAHDDRKASLSIRETQDGTVLLKCFAGCDASAVLSAVGLALRDLFPQAAKQSAARNGQSKPSARSYATRNDAVAALESELGKASALWTYQDAKGEPVGLVLRWDRPDGKDIRPIARHGDRWRIGAMASPRPLYRLPELATAELVVVCEGEKTAEAARSLGYTATTSAGGSQAASKTDWSPLTGKIVWLFPDNDQAGRKYDETAAGIVYRVTPPATVKIIALPGLAEGGDMVDWIAAHGDAAEPAAMRQEIESLARATETWSPVENDALAFRPFPVDALPDPVRGFVTAGSNAIGCDPSYLAIPLLVALAAAIGNTRRLELKRSWLAPPILWCAIVGESGTAKTPAFKMVMRPFRERQRKALERYAREVKQFEADYARWEKAMAAWKRDRKTEAEPPEKPDPPRCERILVADTTMEAIAPILLANPRGLLLGRDELAGWIGSFDRYAAKGRAGADSANWLSMHGAESITVDRKTGIPRTIFVPHAAVCVIGGIQPSILQRALGTEHRESGLAARMLLCWPSRKAKRWSEADVDASVEAELARVVEQLYQLRSAEDDEGVTRPILVRLTPEAKAAWKAYYNAHANEQVDLSGDLSAVWSKLEEYTARLALVIHFIRWAANDSTLESSDRLDLASMEAAIRLTQWFKREARRVYAMLDETEAERDRRRLLEWIERKGGSVTAREVQMGCRWLREPGAAEGALEEAVKAGMGTWSETKTTAKGGRPARIFVLSGPSTSTEPPESPKNS
jgi:hypothetical protein